MKILIIDHDRDLVEMLTVWLRTLGFEVCRAYNGEKARTEWVKQCPDLVIVDASLKGMDTMALCRDMRSKHDALVLVLNTEKDVQDEIRCLEAEADDYLRKPFFPSQLLAHIRAVSRRARATLDQRPPAILKVGPLHINSRRNEVTIKGKTARLTPSESKLLHLLAINANDVCTTEQIVTQLWGYDGDGEAYLIKAHIYHLRQKIELNPGKPQFILTVPGVGYTLIRHDADEDMEELPRPLRVVSR